ncbi:MAG: acyl-CoA thioesterase [Ignavibacteria bacterium]|nr:acyl-CoA thioesterase [Ignavibacteria bacterium]
MEPYYVHDTCVQMTELVLPQHTNQLGNLLGGQLMHWIDICAALAGYKLNGRVCVTASVDRIDFHTPVHLGEVIVLYATVNRVFNSSMEIGVRVCKESYADKTQIHSNSAYLTFVCLGEDGKPVPARQVVPETEVEKRRFEDALVRRNSRLQTP